MKSMWLLPTIFLQFSLLNATCIDFDSLKVWLYSSNIVRVTYEPSIPASNSVSSPKYNSSLVVTYDASNVSINYNITQASSSNSDIYHITTSDLLIIVNNGTKWIGFYDITTNESILTEPLSSDIKGKTFTNISDPITQRSTYQINQQWQLSSDYYTPSNYNGIREALYGFGEYQNGFLNYRDTTVRCVQYNTQACVPFFISNKNYGILFDNYATLLWNQPDEQILFETGKTGSSWTNYTARLNITSDNLKYGNKLGFWVDMNNYTQWGAGNVKSSQYAYVGLFARLNTADSQYTKGNRHNNKKNNYNTNDNDSSNNNLEKILEYDFLFYIPSSVEGFIYVDSNVTSIDLYLSFNGFKYTNATTNINYPILTVRYPSIYTDITSYNAHYFDYYFIYGGSQSSSSSAEGEGLGKVISGYRDLTGNAALYSLKVYGFWQCREHYRNQSELLNAAAEFRRRKLPVDNIVQDWDYWGSLGRGPQWDASIYPNPREMVNELHSMNVNLMVSVWSIFGSQTVFYQDMKEKGYLVNGSSLFDAYNNDAQFEFYTFINNSMFDIGVDFIWLDGTEPQGLPNINTSMPLDNPNCINENRNENKDYNCRSSQSGLFLMNPYSLFVTNAVKIGYYNKSSINTNKKRVFTLTRSSFVGQQATGGALWSGDTTASWKTLYRQITASNNYALSGIPYWSQDIGGFFRPSDQYTNLEYRRLLIRWFQFGTFVPIMRVHGFVSHTEYWKFGPVVEKDVLLVDNLRYRLLPYIYSNAYQIAINQNGSTLQRPLVFDFTNDVNIYGISNAATNYKRVSLDHEFMFGLSMLIVPVYNDNNQTNIYLPKISQSISVTSYSYSNSVSTWYCFWTGKQYNETTFIVNQEVSLNRIPVFIKSGSVVVLGPFVQYSDEIPWIELEIRIYRGNNGMFVLYEDDGQYVNSIQESQFTLIEFKWNDSNKTLVIGTRKGSFNTMIDSSRIFNIVLVDENHGIGVNTTSASQIDKVVTYDGTQQSIVF